MSSHSSADRRAGAEAAASSGARADSADVQLPTDKELVLKVIPLPGDVNANGDIFGGWVMAQVDLAGSVVPARYTQGRMATVAVNEFIFKQPVRVGDLLSFFSSVEKVGRTSITIKVEVYAERIRAQRQYVKVTEASLTYVAIDENGHPRPLPNRDDSHLTSC
jgi:acyl-CoA thioesterase YciA